MPDFDEIILACPVCCAIPTRDGHVFFVDPESWVLYHKIYWRARKARGGFYAFARFFDNGRPVWRYLHRLIAHTPTGLECHHRNGNPFDNRSLNLQNVTPSQHHDIFAFSRITSKSPTTSRTRRPVI
jgi:hypothetical protein